MKKYVTPELLLTKYEIDESIAAVFVSGTADVGNIDTDNFESMFGN